MLKPVTALFLSSNHFLASSLVLNSGNKEKKKEKKKSTMGPLAKQGGEIWTERTANNVQSKIIKLPVRVWLIVTNIWLGGFV